MKKILKQLIKLFPNSHIVIEDQLRYYSHDEAITSKCRPYISDFRYSNDNDSWGKSCNTLKELDAYLESEIVLYKKVYNG